MRDEAEAIEVANDSDFGLGAAVLTRDIARGEHIAAEMIESGSVFVNDNVRSDPRLPFGGIKSERLRPRTRDLRDQGVREHQDRRHRLTPRDQRRVTRTS